MTTKKAISTCGWAALAVLSTSSASAAESLGLDDLWTDTKLYFTAPARWDMQDWVYFGGVLAAIGTAHEFDGSARNHFAGHNPVLDGKDKNSTRDAIPAAAVTFGTWAFAGIVGDPSGRVEAYTMLEAAALSSITTEGIKFAAGRARPDQTLHVDDWRTGGSSFPSLHASAAFAIGTVLAESGGDDFRWIRRILGYGIGAGTSYLRLKDNAHWLSDTVAGAAIGISTGAFTVNRREERHHPWDVSVGPAQGGGVLVGVNVSLP
jgi:membrane-associated phospholipid phosphatase